MKELNLGKTIKDGIDIFLILATMNLVFLEGAWLLGLKGPFRPCLWFSDDIRELMGSESIQILNLACSGENQAGEDKWIPGYVVMERMDKSNAAKFPTRSFSGCSVNRDKRQVAWYFSKRRGHFIIYDGIMEDDGSDESRFKWSVHRQ